MKTTFILTLLFLAAQPAVAEVHYLTNQHMDFRLQYNPHATGSNRLGLILGYDPAQRVANTNCYIVARPEARLTIPAHPDFAFLGEAGSPIWVLPQSQNTALPYLGISGEDIPQGIFENPMELELLSVEGPGNFFAWSISSAGQPPNIKYIATNSTVAPGFRFARPFIGSHEHNNWAFSTNGLYRVTFRTNGRFQGDATNTLGEGVSWAIQILPLRPWEMWISTNWLPAASSEFTSPSADPDQDGIPNALEYAFGLNPNDPASTTTPTVSILSDGNASFATLRFSRAKAASDLTLDWLVSTNLTEGEWTTLETTVVGVAEAGDLEIVTERDSENISNHQARFYRLRSTLHYP